MNKQFKQYLQLLLVFLDVIFLNTSFLIAQLFFVKTQTISEINYYLLFWFSLNISWALLSLIFGVYSGKIIVDFESFTKRTVQVYILWVVFSLFHLVIVREVSFPRTFIFFSISNFAFALIINRFIYFIVKHYIRIKHHWDNKILILGFNDTSKKLASYFFIHHNSVMENAKITIIGTGSWGTALAMSFHNSGMNVTLWGRRPELVDELCTLRHSAYLPGTFIPQNLFITSDVNEIAVSDIILWVAPVQQSLQLLELVKAYIPSSAPIIICSKGLELSTQKSLSSLFKAALPNPCYK